MAEERIWIGLGQAQQELGISERSLRMWMRAAEIEPVLDPYDARKKLLSLDQLAKLRRLQGTRMERKTMSDSHDSTKFDAMKQKYGPFDAWALDVLRRACERAADAPVHTLHIMLAAIQMRWPEARPHGQTPALDRLLNVEQVRIAYEIAFTSALGSLEGGKSPLLRASREDLHVTQALLACLAPLRAQLSPGQKVTFFALGEKILTTDQSILEVLQIVSSASPEIAVAPADLIAEFQRMMAAPLHTISPVDDFVFVVHPSDDRRYKPRHLQTITQILNQLSARQPGELVVCAGMHGTPISRLPYILADLFADHEYLTFGHKLQHLTQVLSMNMGALRAQGSLAAPQLLEAALRRAIEEHALLILDRFELLGGSAQVNAEILGVLARPTQAAVVAMFHMDREESHDPHATFKNLTIRSADAVPYNEERTRGVIKRDFDFSAQGFPLAEDALATLFAVESSVYEQDVRKALPYLATELIQETIRILLVEREGSTSSLLYTTGLSATDALDELDRVGGEAARLRQMANDTYEQARGQRDQDRIAFCKEWLGKLETIEHARQRLGVLRGDPFSVLPTPEMIASGPVLLTRALIDIQLFGSRIYTFHLVEAFKRAYGRTFP